MRRIQRDICHEELIKTLTGVDTGVFGEIWRVLLFAASLGYRAGKRKKLNKVDSGKAMPESYFSTPGWKGFLYLLAVCDSNTSDPLKNDPQQQEFLVQLFEEYANQGLFMLEERLETSVSPIDDLISLLVEQSSEKVGNADVEDLI